MRQLLAAALAALMFVIATAAPLRAQQAPAGASTPIPADKPDPFGERVRTYLLSHPEVIMEAVQLLQERQKLAEAESTRLGIDAKAGRIFHPHNVFDENYHVVLVHLRWISQDNAVREHSIFKEVLRGVRYSLPMGGLSDATRMR